MAAKDTISFMLAYMKVNLQSAMEYRANFLIKTFGMLLNDLAWIAFWSIIFSRFQAINGWSFKDVALLWSVGTVSFGMAAFFFGNWQRLEEIIIKGEMDYYLALPKPTILHVLVSRSEFSGMGDMVFGISLAIVFFGNNAASLLLFIALIPMSMIVLLSFAVVVGSIAFFAGGTGELSELTRNAVTTFMVYPPSIFGSVTKLLIFTILPIGFITGVPVQLLLHYSNAELLYMLAATIASAEIASAVFKAGLKKYESGNLISARI